MSDRILVAGGGGFIGGHLVADLLEAGHVVRAVDMKPTDEW
jgi:GDP-D-mannose 3',5'-epimerase